jgi:hypothetical protein
MSRQLPDTLHFRDLKLGQRRLPDTLHFRDTRLGRSLRRFILEKEAIAFSAGVQIELRTDFDHMLECSNSVDKAPLTPMFHPEKSDIGGHNGFWLKGTSFNGELVHMQACRVDELDQTTLHMHLESLRAFYADPDRTAEDGETCECRAPSACGMTGTVCYHGEIWLKGGPNGFRKRNLTAVTPRLVLAIALLRWYPDVIYGMIQSGIATKGVAARYGYRNFQPHGMIWTVPSTGTLDEWLLWNERRDLIDLVMPPEREC